MFSHPLKADMKVSEITAAGLGIKRLRLRPEQPASRDQGKGTPVWKVWVAVLGFLALLVLVTVLAA